MSADFEPIYAALEARVATLKTKGVRLVSRRMRHWQDVAPADHPAMFIAQAGEAPVNIKGQPAKWLLKADLYVYVHVGNSQQAIPSQQLNSQLALVRNLFEPSPVSGVAPGFEGLCSHVWIGGEIEVFDGVLGAQAVAVVPVELLTV